MTVQEITMGYDAKTGRPITLTEHEKTFVEFCDYKGVDAAAWKKSDQIGYYRALQDDWEAARDDDQDPPVVDSWEDLPDGIRAGLELEALEAFNQIVHYARKGHTLDARNIYDASTLSHATYLEALERGEKLRALDDQR